MPAESVGRFIQSVRSASREWNGFQATQTIETTDMRVEADIRQRTHGDVSVRYAAYECPWIQLEEALTGHVEFVGEELCSLQLDSHGTFTWIYDPSREIVIKKPGRDLFEPLPGIAALGETAFLQTMARDYLVRDLGEHDRAGRRIRRIALKPKRPFRLHLLSTVDFPVRRAVVDLDLETLFPLHISLTPSNSAPAAQLLGPNAAIRISYRNVRLQTSSEPPPVYDPPAGARVFEERPITRETLDDIFPARVVLDPLEVHGFDVSKAAGSATVSTENDRGFLALRVPFADASPLNESPSPSIAITLGNYTSHSMARCRKTFSEHGNPATDDQNLRLLRRAPLWNELVPGIDDRHAPVDVFFEADGILWFLTGVGLGDRMEAIAHDLRSAQSSA